MIYIYCDSFYLVKLLNSPCPSPQVLARVNYDRELEGQAPLATPLNRLFLGNPGTGKTTMAQIYGRVLAALGFLSDGAVELKTPSDLTGSVIGETAEKTAAVIDNARGKVLVIDE